MAKVPWTQIDSTVFEEMTACLIKTMHPTADKFDGRGGDGGRDVRIATPKGEIVYQIKYLQPRLGSAQGHRRQVRDSLRAASALKPRRWILVLPIDLTEGEQEWLAKEAQQYRFPVSHQGAVWLNSQMAKQPQIPRYFLEDVRGELVRLLLQLQKEQAALTGGIRDAGQRIRALGDEIDKISPFYRVDWSVIAGATSIAVVPRYKGAEIDSPLGVALLTDFPNTPAGRRAAANYKALMDYGEPMEIAPRYVKAVRFYGEPALAPPRLGRGTIAVGPTDEDRDFRTDATFDVLDESGKPVCMLPIVLAGRTRGDKGAVLTGSDDRGVVTVRLTANLDRTGSINLKYTLPDSFYPSDVLPSLRFISCCSPPNRVQLRIPGMGPIELNLPRRQFAGGAATYRLLAALTHIQVRTNAIFPISNLTRQDQLTISKLDTLLRGEVVQFGWKPPLRFGMVVTTAEETGELLERMREPNNYRLIIEVSETIAGQAVSIGHCQMTVHGAKLSQRQAFSRRNLRDGMDIDVSMVPAGSQLAQLQLVSSDEPASPEIPLGDLGLDHVEQTADGESTNNPL